MVGALVLPVVSVGITEASIIRNPPVPCTRGRPWQGQGERRTMRPGQSPDAAKQSGGIAL